MSAVPAIRDRIVARVEGGDAFGNGTSNIAPERQPFPVVHLMNGAAPPPPDIQVESFLLDRDINLWVGHGGSAKSVLALVTAVCVAVGRKMLGSLNIRRPGVVLLVVPEDGQSAARMMLDAIAHGLGLNDPERAQLGERLVMVSDEVLVNITTDAARLRDTVLAISAVLVVIDPLRNVIGAAGESDNDVAGCLDTLRREVCRIGGATVLLLHHNRKPGKDAPPDAEPSVFDARGAGGWVNGARLVFNVAKRGDRVTLVATKANRMGTGLKHECDLTIEADPTNKARWISCSIADANAGANSESYTPGVGRPVNANERAALECLDDQHEPGKRVSWSRWSDESGLNPNTFKSVKARLLDAGLAAAHPTGRKTRNGSNEYSYAITDKGRTVLAVQPSKGERVSKDV
jgi:hypothetical protein